MSDSVTTAQQLWLALYLPHLPLEALSRAGEFTGPVVVVSTPHRRARVVSTNAAARARGAQAGRAVSSAMTLIPDLQALTQDSAAEASALGGLADWASQFTSFVSFVDRQGLLLEVGGSVRLFSGLDALLTQVHQGLQGLGYNARMAVAPSPLGAWWLAQLDARCPIVRRCSALAEHLYAVPLELMALPKTVAALARGMGLKCFGDFCRLPREGLTRRFGPELVQLLDRALGERPDPRTPYVAPPLFARHLPLPGLVWEREGLVFAMRRLLLELVGFLQGHSAGVLCLDIMLLHDHAKHTRVMLELAVATRDLQHLLDLLRLRLERVRLAAGVEAIRCIARHTAPLAGQLLSLELGGAGNEAPDKEEALLLLERLRARLGAEAVQGLCAVAEHRPEHAWAYVAIGESPLPCRAALPRPLWLLQQPAMLKPVNDRLHLGGALALSTEPERLESGWWDGGGMERDYFVAQNPRGRRFWIYRERNPPQRWFLHGLFG